MANALNKAQTRTTLYLRNLRGVFLNRLKIDPRFESASEYGRHIFKKGLEADEVEHLEAVKGINQGAE